MDPRRKAARRAGKKIPKNLRPHRPCPQCGQIQPGTPQTPPPHKPGGARRRRERSQETAEPTAATGQRAAPEPIDAKTVIQGVVDRIPAALEGANADGMPSVTAVGVAVRKAVLDEFRTRAQFAGRLAEIDALVWTQAEQGGDLLGGALREHLRELRILRVTEPEASDRFVVTEGDGEAFEVLRPAYVDEVTGKVILAGHLRRVPGCAVGEEA